jgi:polysaccharide biosynthesis/export protein
LAVKYGEGFGLINTYPMTENSTLLILKLFVLVLLVSACGSTKKVTYFNNIQDSEVRSRYEHTESVIQKNDLLSVLISSSVNPDASRIFNGMAPSVGGMTASGSSSEAPAAGYLVDAEGNIEIPVLGTIKAVGLTKTQLKESVIKKLIDQQLLIDPIVSIRFLNFKVTVLGEVSRPTVVNVPAERITLLEALGLAGDLTIYGNRENVMIIREENGKKIIKRMNLNSTELLYSPYYYLKPNDIVYVEPTRARVASTSNTRIWLPVIFSGITVLAISFDRLTR